MDLLVFYCLASLIFVNAAASSIVLIPRAFDSRFRLMAILSFFLAACTFVAFVSASWAILSAGFGLYSMGLVLDCFFFSEKPLKTRYAYIGIYLITALGSLIAFAWGLKIIFMVSYMGYWSFTYFMNKGQVNARLIGQKKES